MTQSATKTTKTSKCQGFWECSWHEHYISQIWRQAAGKENRKEIKMSTI